MEETVEIQEPLQDTQPDPPRKKLWNSLRQKQLYTKSYEDFDKQFSTPESIDKLHKVLSEKQLYTKTTDDFKTQFFSDLTPTSKKKVGTIGFDESSLQAGNVLSQSGGVGGEEIPKVEKNDIDVALEYGKLKGATKWGATTSSGKAGEVFGEIPDEEKRKSANKLAQDFKGTDLEGLSQEFSDFPEAAFERENTSKEALLKLRKENPIQYAARLNNAKTVYKIAEKSDISTANRFNQLADIDYGSLDGFISGKQQQQDIINQTLTGVDKEKATARLKENASRFINSLNPDLVDEYENSDLKGIVDANQYAGLKTWEVFEPEKYKQAIAMLKEPIVPQYQYEVNVTPEEKQKSITTDSALASQYGGKLLQSTINQQIGKETVLRQLNGQGLQNASKDIQYRQYVLAQRNKTAKDDAEKFEIAQAYIQTENELATLTKAQKDEDAKYPYTAQLKFDQQVKDITGDRGASVGELMYNRYAHGIGSTVDAGEDLATTLFGSESDKAKLRNKRIGEQKVFEGSVYLPPNEQRINPEEIIVASDNLKKKVNDILKGRSLGSLSEQERKQVNDLVAANQDEIETVTNPEAGKSKNFFSKATALSVASFTSDIAAFMTNMGMLKGVGLGGKLAEATTLFKDGYTEAFNRKINEGASVNAANEYGLLHGGILALMAKFGSKYEAVQNILKGGKSPLAKKIAGISEETWNNIYNENKGIISRLASSGKNIVKEQGKMVGVFGVAAPTLSSLADNAFYDQHKSIGQMASEATTSAEEMLVGSLGFIAAGLAKGAMKPKATPLEKAALWELGDNPELGKAKIDESVKLNDLTKEEGERRKGTIDKVSKLIEKVPTNNDKNVPLTDNQKTSYLYNLLVKETAKEEAKSLPEKQAEVKEKEGLVADFNNQILLSNSTEKQLISRKEELEKQLHEKDDKGKLVISDQDMLKVEAEIEAIDTHLDTTQKEVKEEELPNLSQPIEGVDEFGVPIGENGRVREIIPIERDKGFIELNGERIPNLEEINDLLSNGEESWAYASTAKGLRRNIMEEMPYWESDPVLKKQAEWLLEQIDSGKIREIKSSFADLITEDVKKIQSDIKNGKLKDIIREVDESMTDETSEVKRAIDDWVGLSLQEVKSGRGLNGIMSERRLQELYKKSPEEIEKIIKPVKDYLREKYPDGITLYRAEDVDFNKREKRYLLSYTTDPLVAKQFYEKGKVNLVKEKVPIDDIVFVTDRFNQSEFIVKSESSKPENKPEVKGQPEQITQPIEPKAETKSEGKTKREDAENKVITVGLSGSRSISDLIKETGKKYDYIDLGDGLVAFTTEPEGTVRTYTVADMKNPAKDGNVIGFSLHQNNKGELGTVNKSNIEMFAKANGQSADAIMARMDELKRKLELVSLEQKGKDVVVDEGVGEGNIQPEIPTQKGEVKGEEVKELDKLANNIPDSGEVAKYMSKETIEKYTMETPTNDQTRGVQELQIALEHGEKIVEKAKEIFGKDYVEKTLDYIDNSTAGVSNKALMYVSLENALGREKLANPDNAVDLTKQQALVYSKSQAFARENSLALNYQKLRKIAQVGYDINKVTDGFFSADELAAKKNIEKAVEADADLINDAAEKLETSGITPEIQELIDKGVESEISKLYEALPKVKKSYADRAIKALEEFQQKLRKQNYSDATGMVAAIDLGITAIKRAIKLGATIADAVEVGIKKVKEKIGDKKFDEDKFREDAKSYFEKYIGKDRRQEVRDILIEKGFGREYMYKGEKKKILDWKKLAGAAGTVSKISENVGSVLKGKGYTESQIKDIKDSFVEEYIDLRTWVIERAQSEMAKRNKETVSPEQKTAAKKLAELYTYGIFDSKPEEFENTLNKALGAKVSEKGFNEAKEIAKALESIYTQTFKGVRLSDISAKAAIEKLEDRLRVLLFREAKSQGNWMLRAANLVRNYFEIQQTMILNNLKQAVENPWSGAQQKIIDKITSAASGESTPELVNQRRKMMKDIYADMILNGGIGYGKVESQFVNRQHIDDYVNKLSDNKLYHGIASVVTGKATLNAMDAMFKAGITEAKFSGNLIKVLTHPTNPKRMSKEDAVKFVSEKLTGQTFKDAQKTAKETIEKINKEAGRELLPTNKEQIDRFANDIVKASLEMGGKISQEQIVASYNAAYKAAGLGLGHEANNVLSSTIKGYSARLEGDINEAIKNKEWNRAAMLTYKSILFRNVLNPFVGGGTNWLVLKLEKTGLGLATGLAYKIGSKSEIDLSSELGMKRLEARLYNHARYKDNFMRGLVGGITSLLTYATFTTIANEDEYRKWRGKNRWAARYLDTITPEALLAKMAVKDGRVKQYASNSFNKNDAFDATNKIIKSVEYAAKSDYERMWGALGEAVGSKLNAPIPWRLVKDGKVIYQGVKGEDPWHGNYKPSDGFISGVLQGGVVEWLGGRPMPKDTPNAKKKKTKKQEKK